MANKGCLMVSLILGVMMALGLTGVVALYLIAPEPTDARPREDTRAITRRLFLEEHRHDDRSRAEMFQAVLRKNEQRCDSVQHAALRDAGLWTVYCAPGLMYVLKFDLDGELCEISLLE